MVIVLSRRYNDGNIVAFNTETQAFDALVKERDTKGNLVLCYSVHEEEGSYKLGCYKNEAEWQDAFDGLMKSIANGDLVHYMKDSTVKSHMPKNPLQQLGNMSPEDMFNALVKHNKSED